MYVYVANQKIYTNSMFFYEILANESLNLTITLDSKDLIVI